MALAFVAPVSCDRAYALVMTDSSEDQYKKVQVLPHPHDLDYPLGYSKSFRCYASSCQVVNPNGLDPPCGMDSARGYATSHRVVYPTSLDPPRGIDSALAASAPAFCEPESSQPTYASLFQGFNPNSLDPPCGVCSVLATSAPVFCEPESSQPPYASSCQVVTSYGPDPPYGVDSAPEYATFHRVVNPHSLDPLQKRLTVNGLNSPGVLFTLNGLDPPVVLLTVNGLDPPKFLLPMNGWECSQQNPPLPDQGIKGLTTGIQHFAKAMPYTLLLHCHLLFGSAPTIKPSAALPSAFQEVGSQWSPGFSNGGVQRSHQDLKRSTKRKTPKTVREAVPIPPVTSVPSATPELTAVQNLRVTMAKEKTRTVECVPSTPVSDSSAPKLRKCPVPGMLLQGALVQGTFLEDTPL
ncbi:hypothetical protein PoB_004600900 [Plakobranchus ocellatus]|uniref:Uncharacterized protein n=1 Tax=Plakobranchus ocellatus TaxID=259542 RepID=A0AAV4BHC6_9GAST|nr:hypothetical protein PoB_004600900 [Plakobranchus ocellatus]